ncbi:MAG: hypothetical protein QM756_10595 [Polyangiaceae bacterium]
MIRVTIKFRGLKEALRDLQRLRRQAVPYAVRDALNTAAFEARREWSAQINKTFTTRNTFTSRKALEVRKVIGKDINAMRAVVGSTADYMQRQELGGTVRGLSGHRPIPGPAAAGQAPGGKRTRIVRSNNRLRVIAAAKPTAGTSKAQRNAIALRLAQQQRKRVAVLERANGGKGLFAVMGRKKITTRLIWDLSRSSARVQPHPTLEPAMRAVGQRFERIAVDAVTKQLKRHHLLGY